MMLKMDDYRLHVTCHFAGTDRPVLLLIHEFGLDGSMWDKLIRRWGSAFNVVTYDMFGHGRTTVSKNRVTPDRLLKEVSVIMHQLHLKKVHLVGAHMGGLLAILAAQAFPKAVVSLSLLSVPYFYPKGVFIRSCQEMIRIFRIDRELLSRIWATTSTCPVTSAKTNYIVRAFGHLREQTFSGFIDLCDTVSRLRDFTLMDELKRLKIPVLILICEKDLLIPKELHMVFSTFIPDSRVFVVPNTSWMMALDEPESVADFIRSFILKKPVRRPVPVRVSQNVFKDMRETLQDALYENMKKRQRVLKIHAMSGGFQVIWKQQEIRGMWGRRHAMELLIYLAVHRGAVARDQLIDELFPDIPVNLARQHLRTNLAHLRKIFRNHPDPAVHHLLVTTQSAVMIDARITGDILDFFRLIKGLKMGKAALPLRTGWFLRLSELYQPGCLDYIRSDWLEKKMILAGRSLSRLMPALVRQLLDHGDNRMARKVLAAGRTFNPDADEYTEIIK